MRAEILVGPERRRRWSVGEKLRIVREAFAPGAHVSDVARRRDVSRGQIYQWRAELRDGLLTGLGTDIVAMQALAQLVREDVLARDRSI